MAVPKKKKSVSRKRIRLNKKRYNNLSFFQCKKCLNFVQLHRGCTCKISPYITNIQNKYNLEIL